MFGAHSLFKSGIQIVQMILKVEGAFDPDVVRGSVGRVNICSFFWHPLPARLKLIGWVGTRMDEGWGLTVWPVNSHPSVWTLVAGSVLVAALLPWSESGPFYSRQMLGRWWGPRYVRPPAPFLLFMWICVWTDAFLPCAPVCFHWTDSKPEFCSGRYWCFACWRLAH